MYPVAVQKAFSYKFFGLLNSVITAYILCKKREQRYSIVRNVINRG